MGKIYNSAYCTMLREIERKKNPEIKRSSKEMSAIDNMAMVADMLMLESRDIKFTRGSDNSDVVKNNVIITSIYEKYPEVYKFLSDMYNTIIDPQDDEAKKVADKDEYLEMNIDRTLRAIEIIKQIINKPQLCGLFFILEETALKEVIVVITATTI